MSSVKPKRERWDYASLEWIHQVRAQIYEEEKRRPLTELVPRLSRRASFIARRLKLKTIRAAKVPIRRQRIDAARERSR